MPCRGIQHNRGWEFCDHAATICMSWMNPTMWLLEVGVVQGKHENPALFIFWLVGCKEAGVLVCKMNIQQETFEMSGTGKKGMTECKTVYKLGSDSQSYNVLHDTFENSLMIQDGNPLTYVGALSFLRG